MENTATKSRVNQTSLLSDLVELLGKDAVLLPIPRGCKGPKIKGWQHFTSAKMQEPEYLAKLNHGGNIGVLLGNGRARLTWITTKPLSHS